MTGYVTLALIAATVIVSWQAWQQPRLMERLILWPPAKLAQEVVRMNAQTADDELDLLQTLYVDVEPQIQADFLAAAGVQAEGAVIPEGLEPPYATAEGVAKGAAAIRAKHGVDGEHYLRVIARYNAAAWPGVEGIVESLGA